MVSRILNEPPRVPGPRDGQGTRGWASGSAPPGSERYSRPGSRPARSCAEGRAWSRSARARRTRIWSLQRSVRSRTSRIRALTVAQGSAASLAEHDLDPAPDGAVMPAQIAEDPPLLGRVVDGKAREVEEVGDRPLAAVNRVPQSAKIHDGIGEPWREFAGVLPGSAACARTRFKPSIDRARVAMSS